MKKLLGILLLAGGITVVWYVVKESKAHASELLEKSIDQRMKEEMSDCQTRECVEDVFEVYHGYSRRSTPEDRARIQAELEAAREEEIRRLREERWSHL